MAKEFLTPQELNQISTKQMAAIATHYFDTSTSKLIVPPSVEHTLRALLAQGISTHVILNQLEKSHYYAVLINQKSQLLNVRCLISTTIPIDPVLWAQYTEARLAAIENMRRKKPDPTLSLFLDVAQQSFLQLPTIRLLLATPPVPSN